MDAPQPGAPLDEEDPSGDFTSPALLAPSTARAESESEFDDETETTGDDFFDELGPSERRQMRVAEPAHVAEDETLDLSEPTPTPLGVEGLLVPGDPSSFSDFSEDSTMTSSDGAPEVTNEIDISEIDEDGSEDDDAVSLDTGDIDVGSIDTGDIVIEEDSIQELDDDVLEELDDSAAEPFGLAPQPTVSRPPPPPPGVSRPPPPPPARPRSSLPPPLPEEKK
jgi:hypothetical protein